MTPAVRVALVPSPRRVPIPRWAAAVVALWLLTVAAAAGVSVAVGVDGTLCSFRRVTGVPCPTCGATRAALAALDGRMADALLFNPLLLAGAVAGLAWLFVRLGLGRRLVLHLSRGGRRAAWGLGAGVFLLNWAYVIWRAG